ncbi:uncharacterized protein LOC105837808 [Monomorium pharaonis]|uniref:uncharacterized protein LOC105837808 n=1 Tax=Monomorium pharaonis TaxID=307658 RepID=UPI001746D525|nr:uncharacterized protein LOC105837808 [Monomorium pharaonis]
MHCPVEHLQCRSSSESTVEQFINENVETVSQEINYSPIVPTKSTDVINGSLSPITKFVYHNRYLKWIK